MTTREQTARDSDIAVVGLACRFPGAGNTDEFWRNLRGGVESVEFLTDEQLLAEGADPDRIRDPAYVKARACLSDLDQFDPRFFGFSPRDAAIMDPQHRHFLECAYECLENAGHTPRRFKGSIGVFAGSGCNLYLIHNLFSNPELIDEIGFFQVKHTGNDKDYLATRLSYCLNLTGPSVNLQTACSTSLVAIHMASQSLLNGECDLALAGGVTIDTTLTAGYRYQEGEVLSPDGHCRAFDHRAKGTVFGNGAGVVALRRLEDALRDGDTIHAVVKGSAINNDGSSKVGYFAPSVEGQYRAITQALGVAEVPAESITYVETHGTGTIVGDPIEVRALTEAFRTQTDRKGFCGLGSVKTNVGHLDTAAGVASFIKVVEALRHRELPPSLNFETPNPAIDFEESPFYVNTKLRDWPAGSAPRRAGVNSLAVGGTNAHVIVEEAPPLPPSSSSRPYSLLLLSARSEAALDAATARLAAHLRERPEANLGDVAFTFQTGRAEFEFRRMLVGRDVEEVTGALECRDDKRTWSSTCPDEPCEVAFMFTGQGAQYVGMAAEVYGAEPTFRSIVDQCSALLVEDLGLRLSELLFGDGFSSEEAGTRLTQTAVAQPALFVVEYALAKLWIEWGVQPAALIGHSIGEYVAACIAGVFSLKDALSLVAARGRLMQSAPRGAMLAVKTGEEALADWVKEPLSLAAVNSPSSCVVSGPYAEIEALEELLAARGIQATRLHTSHAFHSAMMDGILDLFSREFAGVRLSPPRIPFVSNVTGKWITSAEATDPRYWVQHLRRTVRFADGLTTLLDGTSRLLLEVGPGNTLCTLARQHPSRDASRAIVSSLAHVREKSSDERALLSALGQLWLSGVEIDWDGFYAHERRRRIPLPTYPFEHRRCWIERRKRQREETAIAADAAPTSGRQKLDDWFWKPAWKKTPWPEVAANPEAASWLVFADESRLSAEVLGRLGEHLEGTRDDGRSHRLELGELGEFGSLKVRSSARGEPGAHEVEIEARALGLNFRDVLIALGAYPDAESAVMGSECAGVITRVGASVTDLKPGDEVVAVAPGFQTHVTVGTDFVALKPRRLSFEAAATIPVSFMTAHYALCEVGKLSRGERVLIQAAAGGVGFAAVQIAKQLGAEVFATAGSPEKRAFLQSFGIRHVFDSRSVDFADGLLEATGGEGVDVVLNSLAGEFIVKGLAVLRPFGRFLEIGKADIYGNNQIGLEPFKKNISFCSIDLEIVAQKRREFYGSRLRELLAEFQAGRLEPLPFKEFPLRKAPQAFDYMAKAKHIGKIVLSVEREPSSVISVKAGAGFRRVSDSQYEVDPRDPEDYRSLLSALEAAGRAPDRLLHLWSAAKPPSGIDTAGLDDLEVRSFYSLLHLAQAFADRGVPDPVRMAVVSMDAQCLRGEDGSNALGALASGPALVIPREIENLSCVSIDLSSSRPAETESAKIADRLVSELEGDGARGVVAYRDGERYVQTFEPVRLQRGSGKAPPLRRQGVYVITGGFGGLGLVFAGYLAREYQARLVLIGRTPIPSRKEWQDRLARGEDGDRAVKLIRAVKDLESQGGEVLAACADVADATQLKAVIDQALSRFGTINGVIHAAGHIEDAPIALKTAESARNVLRPKVEGTLALHAQLSHLPLDFFVLFSSVSAVTAPAGQIDYAAANAFLNSLASHESARGDQRTVAIEWGAWRDVGMAVRALEEQIARRARRRKPGDACGHPLIERCTAEGSDGKVYSTYPLGVTDWLLSDHRLRGGPALLPGTGYLELIRGALQNEVNGSVLEVRDVVFHAPFVLDSHEQRRLRISLRRNASAWDVVVSSAAGGTDEAAVEHVTASVAVAKRSEPPHDAVGEIRKRCARPSFPAMDGGPLLLFGPRWKNLKELHLASDEAFAKLELPKAFASDLSEFRLHPALLDIALACGFPLIEGYDPEVDSYVPLGCERLVVRGPLPETIYSHVRRRASRRPSRELLTFDVALLDERGAVLVEVEGFTFKKVAAADLMPRQNGARDESRAHESASPSGNSLEEAVRAGISPEEGIEAFERILRDRPGAQVIVSPFHLLRQLEDQDSGASSSPGTQAETQAPAQAEKRTAVADVPPVERAEPANGSPSEAQRDEVQSSVLDVLKKALGVDDLSPDEDFFELGGDSLSAMRVVTQLKNRFATSLPIGTLFENPTARELTAVLKEKLA